MKGPCPVCGRRVQVRNDGRLRRHPSDPMGTVVCAGTATQVDLATLVPAPPPDLLAGRVDAVIRLVLSRTFAGTVTADDWCRILDVPPRAVRAELERRRAER